MVFLQGLWLKRHGTKQENAQKKDAILLTPFDFLLFNLKLVFANSTKWTYPIFRQIFEARSWSYSIIFVSNCRIINISAY